MISDHIIHVLPELTTILPPVLVIGAVVSSMRTLFGKGGAKVPATKLPAGGGQLPAPPSGGKKLADIPVPPRNDASVRELKKSFRRELSGLRSRSEERDYLYSTPWFLMVGATGSGKSTLLKNSAVIPWGANTEEELNQHADCTWWAFDQGIVLDIVGDYVLGVDGSSHEKGWRTLMQLLQKYRYRRPIDGVIVTIACTDLIGPNKLGVDELAARGAAINRKLRLIEQKLGMCVPVYPVITMCDAVTGFSAFCQHLPEERRNDIFGWSNPHTRDTAYSSQWVDEAFATMAQAIYPHQLGMMAGPGRTADADALFLFPGEFQTMLPGLRAMLDQLFRSSSTHESAVMMRGVFFTGDAGTAIAESNTGEEFRLEQLQYLLGSQSGNTFMPGSTADTNVSANAVEPAPCFVRSLFAHKIFPEHRLAYPIAGSTISKNRKVLAIQIAMVVLAVLGGIAMGVEYGHIADASQQVERIVGEVHSDMATVRERNRLRDRDERLFHQEEAIRLLTNMAQIDSNRLWSLAFPTSFISPLRGNINRLLTVAFHEIIVLEVVEQLDNRAEQIISMPAVAPPIDTAEITILAIEKTPEFYDLRRYVDELRRLEIYSAMYADFRRYRRWNDIRQVVKYLFDRDLPRWFVPNEEFYHDDDIHEEFDFTPYHDDAVEQTELRLSRLQDRLFAYNPLLAGGRAIVNDITALEHETGFVGVETMRRLHTTIIRAQDAIAGNDLAWMNREEFDPGPAFLRVRRTIDTLSQDFLSPNVLMTRFQDTCSIRFTALRNDLAAVRSDVIGPVFKNPGLDSDMNIQFSSGIDTLRVAMDGLLSQKFMHAASRPTLINQRQSGTRVVWVNEIVAQACALHDPYRAFISEGVTKFPQGLESAAENAAASGLEATMLTAIVDAQRTAPRSHSEDDIRTEVKSLQGASENLTKALGIFEQIQKNGGNDLLAMLRGQVNDMLNDIGGFLNSEGLYSIPRSKIDSWHGESGLALALFDARDPGEINGYLARWHDRTQQIADEYAKPLLTFLSDQSMVGGNNRWWSRMVQELHKYENKIPGNSVSTLEVFFQGLNDITLANYQQKLNKISADDYFLQKREELRDALYRRCSALLTDNAGRDYKDLADEFNNVLAGRYPFAEITRESIQDEVTVDELRTFFAHYDRSAATYRDAWSKWKGSVSARQNAARFLDRIEEARQFLAPLFVVDDDKTQALDVDVEFRANSTITDGSNYIIDWKLELGSQVVNSQGTVRRGTWAPGDLTRLTLRWAKNAPAKPTDITDGHQILHSVRRLDDTLSVEYTFRNRWSLLRFLDEYPYDPQDVVRSGPGKPNLLEFKIRTRLDGEYPDADQLLPNNRDVKLFIRLGILGSVRRDRLRMPSFPRQAPVLE